MKGLWMKDERTGQGGVVMETQALVESGRSSTSCTSPVQVAEAHSEDVRTEMMASDVPETVAHYRERTRKVLILSLIGPITLRRWKMHGPKYELILAGNAPLGMKPYQNFNMVVSNSIPFYNCAVNELRLESNYLNFCTEGEI